jgi:hypothetical protein
LGVLFEYLKIHGTTNPKNATYSCEENNVLLPPFLPPHPVKKIFVAIYVA